MISNIFTAAAARTQSTVGEQHALSKEKIFTNPLDKISLVCYTVIGNRIYLQPDP